jgi:hypothetical protein
MVKAIKISDDNGTNYYTLPGNTGEFVDDLGELDDTIFGQNFKSGQPNLIGWSVSANAFYRGFAGYVAEIKKQNTSTAMTGEAMTLVSGKTYRINAATKRIWDRTVAFTFYDGVTDVTDEVASIDFLFGKVTFKSTYTVVGSVTVDGSYWTTTSLARYRSFTLGMTQESIDETDIPSAQGNNGHMIFSYGLKTISLDLSGVYQVSNGYRASLVARDELIIEIDPGGNDNAVARGYFRPLTRSQSGNVGDLEEENASFTLTVPQTALLATPFSWEFSSSPDLSTAVQKLLEAYLGEETLKVDYSDNGSTGHRGDVIVADMSLSGGIEAMNEFSVTLQGTGAVTAY